MSRVCALALCAAFVAAAPASASAREQGGGEEGPLPHRGEAALWSASASEVREWLAVEALEPGRPGDALPLDLMRELDIFQLTDLLLRHDALSTPVSWASHTFSHPELGVGLDRRLRALIEQRPRRALQEPLRFLLAHQQAHTVQLRTYSLASLTRPGARARIEAQADVLAGVAMAQSRALSRRPTGSLRADVERGIALDGRLGGPPCRRAPPEQRLRLASTGLAGGDFYAAAWSCRVADGDAELARLRDGAVRRALDLRNRNTRLPGFDPATCSADDVLDWALGVARTELRRAPEGSGRQGATAAHGD